MFAPAKPFTFWVHSTNATPSTVRRHQERLSRACRAVEGEGKVSAGPLGVGGLLLGVEMKVATEMGWIEVTLGRIWFLDGFPVPYDSSAEGPLGGLFTGAAGATWGRM
jgi:hypothetical protein